ncbi:hypothetical protein PoB_003844900 [Plakobranchus ocellatus]|uniref:Uncharacterized protein n=1 Tax=Plakobranchus ocellatus TaxID=259542 RepID=A0AAV4AVW9_9GAST|nr:hypothetical protein PoB_003844900 [Plakobranchus ocellatus]
MIRIESVDYSGDLRFADPVLAGFDVTSGNSGRIEVSAVWSESTRPIKARAEAKADWSRLYVTWTKVGQPAQEQTEVERGLGREQADGESGRGGGRQVERGPGYAEWRKEEVGGGEKVFKTSATFILSL